MNSDLDDDEWSDGDDGEDHDDEQYSADDFDQDDGTVDSGPDIPTWQTAVPAQFSVGKGVDATLNKCDTKTTPIWSVYKDVPILEAAVSNDSGPWIRLLKLLPGEWDDDIRCDLIRRPLFDTPTYVALSYAWSSGRNSYGLAEEERFPIEIGKQSTPFSVSLHLWEAIRRCRNDLKKPMYLWVDAVCIDQGNLLERAEQVNIMAQIYNSAEEVRIWLGENPSFHYEVATDDGLITMLCQDTRPWWCRLWILQECAYARQCPVVMIGPISMSLRDLIDRWAAVIAANDVQATHMGPHYEPISKHLSLLRVPYDLWRAQVEDNKHRRPLLYRLRETFNRQCTEPHDRIFALLNLVDEREARTIQPDYRRSFPDLWLQTIRTLRQSPDWDDERDAHFYDFEPFSRVILKRVSPSEYREALVEASRQGHLNVVLELLDISAQYGGLAAHHQPAYLAAVQYDQREVAMLLLQRGAAFYEQIASAYAESLSIAAKAGHTEMLETLLSTLQDFGSNPSFYADALHSAFEHLQIDVARVLIEKGALQSIEDAFALADVILTQRGQDDRRHALLTLLMHTLLENDAVNSPPCQSTDSQRLSVISAKAKMFRRAANNNDAWAIQSMFHHKFDAGASDADVEIAMVAAHSGLAVSTMERLLTEHPMIVLRRPQSLLLRAIRDDNIELVRLLLLRGARVCENLVCPYDDTALELAARRGRHHCIKLLLKHTAAEAKGTGVCQKALTLASRNGHLLAVQTLLEEGVPIVAGTDRYSDPLSAALYYGNTEVAGLLIQNGAKQILSARQLMATDDTTEINDTLDRNSRAEERMLADAFPNVRATNA